ncbi:MAG: dienelactone hydrolase family protein, partial [Acidimicrobiia bacterium]
QHLTLTAEDGNEFTAFEAVSGSDVAVLVLPDVRGLFQFYEELALRFAEHGTDAIAIDYFGRTAGTGTRDAEFDFWPQVEATTIEGITSDVVAAIDHLRRSDADRPVFIVGFCFGGSNSWHMAASDLGLSGVVGFYGHPDRPGFPKGAPSVLSRVPDFDCPVLALQGGDDPGIPVDVDDMFRDAMEAAEVPGEVIVYPGAPHSFFDRKFDEFGEDAADAWQRIQRFIADHT